MAANKPIYYTSSDGSNQQGTYGPNSGPIQVSVRGPRGLAGCHGCCVHPCCCGVAAGVVGKRGNGVRWRGMG